MLEKIHSALEFSTYEVAFKTLTRPVLGLYRAFLKVLSLFLTNSRKNVFSRIDNRVKFPYLFPLIPFPRIKCIFCQPLTIIFDSFEIIVQDPRVNP